MQKKLIALAVAGLASSAAFAQTNVTIYGVLDIFYANLNSDQIVNAANPTGKDNKFSGLLGGGLSGSRLGFRVEEDLGNGWKAHGLLELGTLNPDGGAQAGAASVSGAGSTRQSFVGLSNAKFGTFQAGRIYTAGTNAAGKFDPEAASAFGPVSRITGGLGLTIDGGASTSNARVNNSLNWLSPNWSGFTAQVQYAFGENGEMTKATANGVAAGSVICSTAGAVTVVASSTACTTGGGSVIGTPTTANAGGNSDDARMWGLGLDYTNGPLSVAGVYNKWSDYGGTANGTPSRDLKEWFVGGSYDFGMVKVLASYQDFDMDNMTTAGTQGATAAGGTAGASSEGDIWSLGVVVPVFKVGAITVSYASLDRSTKTNTAAARVGADADGWGITYKHNFSKRTTAYVGYTKLDNDNRANTLSNLGIAATTTLGAPAAGKDSSGYGMGVRHTF